MKTEYSTETKNKALEIGRLRMKLDHDRNLFLAKIEAYEKRLEEKESEEEKETESALTK